MTSQKPEKPIIRSETAETTKDASESLVNRVRIAAFWIAGTTLVWQVVAWGLTLVTARILLPEDYGILSMAETVSPFVALLASLNVGTWIIQSPRFEQHDRAAMYTLTSLLGLAMTTIAFLGAPLVGAFYGNEEVVGAFRVLSVVFVLRGTAVVPLSVLRRDLKFKPLSLMESTVGISSGLKP